MKAINYTREDIIRRTGDKLNLTHDEMKLILDTTLDTVSEMLTEDKSRIRIELRKFGIFEVKPTKAKPRARNPKTNEEGIRIPTPQTQKATEVCRGIGCDTIGSYPGRSAPLRRSLHSSPLR